MRGAALGARRFSTRVGAAAASALCLFRCNSEPRRQRGIDLAKVTASVSATGLKIFIQHYRTLGRDKKAPCRASSGYRHRRRDESSPCARRMKGRSNSGVCQLEKAKAPGVGTGAWIERDTGVRGSGATPRSICTRTLNYKFRSATPRSIRLNSEVRRARRLRYKPSAGATTRSASCRFRSTGDNGRHRRHKGLLAGC